MVKLMKKTIIAVAILLVAAALLVGAGAAAQGEIVVKCNEEGATVTLYAAAGTPDETKQIINGEATFLKDTAAPLAFAIVSKNGFESQIIPIQAPVAGHTTPYYAELKKIETGLGGSFGFLQVLTNVIGADVKLCDASGKTLQSGTTDNNGIVTFKVMLTATPAKSVVISANGYTTQQMGIGTVPGAGETQQMTIKLQSDVKPTVPTPQPATPMPIIGILAGLGATAVVLLKRRA